MYIIFFCHFTLKAIKFPSFYSVQKHTFNSYMNTHHLKKRHLIDFLFNKYLSALIFLKLPNGSIGSAQNDTFTRCIVLSLHIFFTEQRIRNLKLGYIFFFTLTEYEHELSLRSCNLFVPNSNPI